jgi:hypothetical protein
VGQVWQREERGRGFNQIFKSEIGIKIKGFFEEKTFQHPIKSRKINLIFAKITLNDFDLLIT